jgi:hypothetical protein
MKAYIITTGSVFGLITVAHLLRFVTEFKQVITEPIFILLTILAAALSIWAWTVLPRSSR